MKEFKSVWLLLSQIGLVETQSTSIQSKLILNCNKLTTIIGFILLQNIIFYSFYGLSFYAFFNFLLTVLLIPVYLLNKFHFYTYASIYLVYFCNLGIFCLDSMTGKAAGNYVYFINIILLNFFVFNYSQKYLIFFNFIFTSTLMLLLEYTNHSLLMDHTLSSQDQKYIFIVTVISNTMMILFSIYNIAVNQANTENALQEEEKILKSMYNLNPLGVALLDTDKKIKSYNINFKISMYKLSGLDINQGDEFTQYLPVKERLNFINYFNLSKEGKSIRIEKNFTMDFTSLWFDILFNPIMLEQTGCNGVVLTFIDISERKNLEIRSHIAKEKAEVANIAKSHFLSTISNEIRSPMKEVIEITNNLIESNPNPDQKPSLVDLKFSTENLLHLINDILDYEIIEVESINTGYIEFDFLSTFLFVREFYQNRIHHKGLDFKYIVDERIPRILIGDPVRLRQIIMHLLNNSIKYTEKGEVTFRADYLDSDKEIITISFSIQDTGSGIASKKLEKILHEFYSMNTQTIMSSRNFGLGFTIIKKLLELLGSKIFIESEVGVGSKFNFNVNFYIPQKVKSNVLDFDDLKGKK